MNTCGVKYTAPDQELPVEQIEQHAGKQLQLQFCITLTYGASSPQAAFCLQQACLWPVWPAGSYHQLPLPSCSSPLAGRGTGQCSAEWASPQSCLQGQTRQSNMQHTCCTVLYPQRDFKQQQEE